MGTGAFARPAKRSDVSSAAGAEVMTNKPKYAGLGIALGAALGAVFGVIAGHIGIWLALGVAIGVALGASFRSKKADCPQCAQLHRVHELRRQV